MAHSHPVRSIPNCKGQGSDVLHGGLVREYGLDSVLYRPGLARDRLAGLGTGLTYKVSAIIPARAQGQPMYPTHVCGQCRHTSRSPEES